MTFGNNFSPTRQACQTARPHAPKLRVGDAITGHCSGQNELALDSGVELGHHRRRCNSDHGLLPVGRPAEIDTCVSRPLEPQRQTPTVGSSVDESARLDAVNEFENIDRHAVRRSDRGPV